MNEGPCAFAVVVSKEMFVIEKLLNAVLARGDVMKHLVQALLGSN